MPSDDPGDSGRGSEEGHTGGSLLKRLKTSQTAAFQHGAAWDTPVLTSDGIRGVGVTDFERGVTRVVQIGLPDAVLRQIEDRRSRNPLRRWGYRIFGAVLRQASVAREIRFARESVWIRDDGRSEWEEVPLPEVNDPRPFTNDPTWILQLLRNATRDDGCFEVDAQDVKGDLPGGVVTELGLERTSRPVGIRLEVALAEGGRPRRIGALVPSGRRPSGQTIWQVLEFTEYGVSFEEVDLWQQWCHVRQGPGP